MFFLFIELKLDCISGTKKNGDKGKNYSLLSPYEINSIENFNSDRLHLDPQMQFLTFQPLMFRLHEAIYVDRNIFC